MAEDPLPEAAGHRPALELEVGCAAGRIYVNVKIDRPWLAAGVVGAGIVTLATLYQRNPEGVETAVRNALAGLADRVLSIRPSSVLVDLCFHTKERFLAFVDAFVTGIVKQRFQEEFSKIGFKDKLEVTVTVYDMESEMRKEMMERSSDFGAASESPGVELKESDPEETISPQSSTEETLSMFQKLTSIFKKFVFSREETPVSPKSRKEMGERSSDFGAASESSGVELWESEETISPESSPAKPLARTSSTSELMKESRLRSRSLILRPSPPRSIRKASEKEKVFVKADESSGIGSGLGEMKGGGIKIVPREGSLEIFKLSLSEQETPASPKSRRERMEGRFPPFIARSESMKSHVKAGTLGDIVLEKVAIRIWREWKKLGRRLGVSDEKLQEIDQAHRKRETTC